MATKRLPSTKDPIKRQKLIELLERPDPALDRCVEVLSGFEYGTVLEAMFVAHSEKIWTILGLQALFLHLSNQVGSAWPRIIEDNHARMETPFDDAFRPALRDGEHVSNLLAEVALTIGGAVPWTELRRAARAIYRGEVSVEARQVLALKRCAWARQEWRKLAAAPRLRGRRETETSFEERLERVRVEEKRVIRALLAALKDQDLRFQKLQSKHNDVRALLNSRPRSSAVLLEALAVQAEIPWTRDAIKQAASKKKRQV